VKESEKKIEQRFVKKCPVPTLKLNVMFSRGWPDRCVWLPGGRPFLIEFKKPGEALSPLQEKTHAQLKSLGYDVETHTVSDAALAAVWKRIHAVNPSKPQPADISCRCTLPKTVDPPRLPKARGQVARRALRGMPVPRPRAR
jgi:hypothetical protein